MAPRAEPLKADRTKSIHDALVMCSAFVQFCHGSLEISVCAHSG
jgi:hypothetical protein